MGIIWSLIIGGVAGWLAGTIMKGEGYGVLVNILLGIVVVWWAAWYSVCSALQPPTSLAR